METEEIKGFYDPLIANLVWFVIIAIAIFMAITWCNIDCNPKATFNHVMVAVLCPVCYIIYALLKCGASAK